MSGQNRRKNRRVRKAVRAAMFLIPLCALLSCGWYVYAKYLAQSVQKGVALASSIYFTSNHAAPSGSSLDDMTDALVSVAESGDGDGRNYDFNVEIRNYENILLYNSSNAKIPYTVSFQLAATPAAGDSYKVTASVKKEADGRIETVTGETQTLSANDWVTFENELPGGEALSDDYQIQVTSSAGNPVPIYVRANTKDGALLTERLKGKIMLQARADSGDFLKTYGFSVPSDGTDAEKFAALQKQSEFSYKITTGGISADAGSDADVVTLYWDSAVYDIDRFSNAYLAWEESENTGPKEIDVANLQSLFPGETWSQGWNGPAHCITIKMSAYASVNIGFFRGVEYGLKVETPASNQGQYDYDKYVHVVKGNHITD